MWPYQKFSEFKSLYNVTHRKNDSVSCSQSGSPVKVLRQKNVTNVTFRSENIGYEALQNVKLQPSRKRCYPVIYLDQLHNFSLDQINFPDRISF